MADIAAETEHAEHFPQDMYVITADGICAKLFLVFPGVVTEAGEPPELQTFSPPEGRARPPEEVEAGGSSGGGVEEGVTQLGVEETQGEVSRGEDLLVSLSKASSITT